MSTPIRGVFYIFKTQNNLSSQMYLLFSDSGRPYAYSRLETFVPQEVLKGGLP